jgi:D-inositol-3-phosphate glycosyltransferase
VVTFTRFGREVFERAFAGSDLSPPPVSVIPHGVDAARFRPLVPADPAEGRRMARDLLFPGRPDLADAFVVLNANRNNPRKRVDLTLAAFAAFAEHRPDALLYLHMGMRDSGFDLLPMAAELGIRERLLLTTESPAKPEISDEHLNLIYNACDVGINTSNGEGWGLVAFEHGATGAAQVLPEHSACAELWTGRALLVPVAPTAQDPWEVSVPAAAAALGRLYDDRALLRELSGRALQHARSGSFDWGHIADRWEELLLACAAEPPRSPLAGGRGFEERGHRR